MSRRSVIAGLAAIAATAATGCSSGFTRNDALGSAGSVRILNWSDYIDPGLVSIIGDQTTMTVNYTEDWQDNYQGWDLIGPGLAAGNAPSYDIVVPTNWLAQRMHGLGYIQPVPLEVVPNHVNIEPSYLTNGWDRGSRFNMPWQAGITGIAYDASAIGREIRSIEELFNPEFAGRVGMIGEMREALGLTMLANGDDPARATVRAANQAIDRVEQSAAAGQFAGWFYDDFVDGLQSGDLLLSMAWSGQAATLIETNPNIRFVVPDEGAIRWFDTMVIPVGATAVHGAGKWMNAVYDPAIAAQITSYVQYISPVIGVREELQKLGGESARLADNRILFPDDETSRRLFTWDGLSAAADEEFDDRFAELL